VKTSASSSTRARVGGLADDAAAACGIFRSGCAAVERSGLSRSWRKAEEEQFARAGDLFGKMTNTLQLRILVVDDEALIRWSLCELLRLHGHTVLEAASASDARAAIDDATPAFNVVLLDCRLPDSHDLTLLEEIRWRMPESAVGLMTAYLAWRVLSSAASPRTAPSRSADSRGCGRAAPLVRPRTSHPFPRRASTTEIVLETSDPPATHGGASVLLRRRPPDALTSLQSPQRWPFGGPTTH
jgi:CheY-like chemotaxis protein